MLAAACSSIPGVRPALCGQQQHADDRRLGEAQPAGRERQRGRQRGGQRDEHDHALGDAAEAERQRHEVQPRHLARPGEHAQTRPGRECRGTNSACRARSARTARASARAARARSAAADGACTTSPTTTRTTRTRPTCITPSTAAGTARPNDSAGRRQHQQEQDHDVDDALGEDGADRRRERDARVQLEQVGAVRVAELGRARCSWQTSPGR